MQSAGVVAEPVPVLVEPLRGQVGQGVDGVVPSVAVRVNTTQAVALGGVAGLARAGVRLRASSVVTEAITVGVEPLGDVVGVRIADVRPTVAVGVQAAVRVVLPRITVLVDTTIGQVAGGVVPVAVTVGVVPLGGLGHEGVGAVGHGEVRIGVRVPVPVLVGAPESIGGGGARKVGTSVLRGVVVPVPVEVAPPGGVVREGVSALCDGPRAVGVRIPVAVGVGAALTVHGGVAAGERAIVAVGSAGVVTKPIAVGVHPLGGVVGRHVRPVDDRPGGVRVRRAVAVAVGATVPVAVGRAGGRRARIGFVTRGVVAVAVAVAVDPLGRLVVKGVVEVGVPVPVVVEAAQAAHLRGIAVLVRTSVRVGAGGVVAVAVAIGVRPLRVVRWEGVCPLSHRPAAVGVRVTVAVGVSAPVPVNGGGAQDGRTSVAGGGGGRVVAVAVVVGVVPLRGIRDERIRSGGHGPHAVGVGVPVAVLVGTARPVFAGIAGHGLARIGAVGRGPRHVGVGVAIAVRVGATEPVKG